MPQPRNSSPSPALEAAFITKIDSALSKHAAEDLARLFEEGAAKGAVPASGDLPGWLLDRFGREQASRVIRTFASWPCPYCSRGFLPCDQCEGRGRFGDAALCDRCLAFGVARCEFCVGSGWFTYNAVPRPLWGPVLLERVRKALEEVEKLLERPAPVVQEGNPAVSRKQLARAVLSLDRRLGVFENAASIGRDLRAFPESMRSPVTKALDRSRRAASKAKVRLRNTFRAIAEASALEGGKAGSTARSLAKQRTLFYKSLAKCKSFSDTALRHVMLERIAKSTGRSTTRPEN